MANIQSNYIRLVFILPLGAFGVMHFIVPEFFVSMVPDFLPPGKFFWIYFSGVALVAASFSMITRIYCKLAARLLVLFILTFIIVVDVPGVIEGGVAKNYYFVISLLKDLSLMGATMLYIQIFKMEGY